MPLRFAEPATSAYRMPLTIRHLLTSALTTSADQEIVYRDRLRFTYRDLVGRIGRLASALAGLGAEQGMTIAVMDWDSHRYLDAYFAVPMMGAVLQTVNVRLPAGQIAYTLAHARAEILIVHQDFLPLVDAVLPALAGVRAVIVIMDEAPGTLPAYAAGEYEALLAAAAPDYPFADFDEDAIATTFYTTGTTGDPKGVCFSHRQLVLHTLAANAPFGAQTGSGLGYRDVYMPLTPMFHVHAWGMPYVATMLGVKQVYPGRYEPAMICRLRTEHRVTYSHCVPTILQMVLQAADASGADLSGWMMTIGGAALTSTLCADARRRGMNVMAGYGMSETAPLVAVARVPASAEGDEAATVAALTATIPTPLVSARVIDADGRDVPADGQTRGELVLRAPWLTPCYTGDPAASEALWRGGWLHTQDLATIDAQGQLRIRDRLKDVIKTGGEWIDSLAVEELLVRAAGVAEVAVIGVPDPHWSERPLAIVVPRAGAAVTLEALNGTLAEAIAAGAITRFARLERFETVAALPRTSVGKIDKKLLRVQFGSAVAATEPALAVAGA